MTENERYIGGPTGGVPERIFHDEIGFGSSGVTKGKSGANLRYFIDENLVSIRAIDEPTYSFRASRYYRKPNMLTLGIFTKNKNEEKHPDLYAAKLVKESIEHFDEQGTTIDIIKSLWISGDNYDVYKSQLNSFRDAHTLVTEEHKKQAAKSTWAGELASSLGFTEIQAPIPDKGAIIVFFGKPNL